MPGHQNVINMALSLVFFSLEHNLRLYHERNENKPQGGPNIWLLLNVKVIKNKAKFELSCLQNWSEMISECNMGSWDRRRTLGEN